MSVTKVKDTGIPTLRMQSISILVLTMLRAEFMHKL